MTNAAHTLGSTQTVRRSIMVVAAIAVLGVAAFVFGTRLLADTTGSTNASFAAYPVSAVHYVSSASAALQPASALAAYPVGPVPYVSSASAYLNSAAADLGPAFKTPLRGQH